MWTVSLCASPSDEKWLLSRCIDLVYISDCLTTILNFIRPRKGKTKKVKLEIVLTNEEYSYYNFTSQLFITKKVHTKISCAKSKKHFLQDLVHEFAHYVQFSIDKVPVFRFAIDHEETSMTTYYKNRTEVQARTTARLATECILLYKKLKSLKRFLAPIT